MSKTFEEFDMGCCFVFLYKDKTAFVKEELRSIVTVNVD
jgi:hypothetical protein